MRKWRTLHELLSSRPLFLPPLAITCHHNTTTSWLKPNATEIAKAKSVRDIYILASLYVLCRIRTSPKRQRPDVRFQASSSLIGGKRNGKARAKAKAKAEAEAEAEAEAKLYYAIRSKLHS